MDRGRRVEINGHFGRKTQPALSDGITEPYGNALGTRTAVAVPPLTNESFHCEGGLGSDAPAAKLFTI